MLKIGQSPMNPIIDYGLFSIWEQRISFYICESEFF
jgi:hypothetical protein